MASTTYLTRTPSSAGNRKTFTFSAWIKGQTHNPAGTTGGTLFSCGTDTGSGPLFIIDFLNARTLRVEDTITGGSQPINVRTNRTFRDANAWWHIVVAVDTTQGTASDRVKIYVNGEQETSLSATTYPSQNIDTSVNNTHVHIIGGRAAGLSNKYFDGCMSHIHFSDGYAYAPTVFGSTDSTTGEWKINTSPSFTLGTNGFTILKDGNTITDQSSNSNNWTLAGGTLTKTEDNPSNVFATLNPLYHYLDSATLSNGNTAFACGSSPKGRGMATIRPSAGKYYAEYKITNSSRFQIGIMNGSETNSQQGGADTNSVIVGYSGSCYFNDSSFNSYCGSFSDNDIVMIAIDCDNKLAWLGKNGTWFQSATTTEIQNGTATNSLTTFISSQNPMSDTVGIFAENNSGSGSHDGLFNFGNGYFGTTAVSSAGTNASGIGIFEYDVPTGYTALSTKGLNE